MDQNLEKQPDNVDDRRELWQWAGGVVKEMRTDLEDEDWGDYFTVEERKTGVRDVQTGIKRPLWDESEEEGGEGDEDGDENMAEDDAIKAGKKADTPPIPLETLLRFAVGAVSLPARAKG